MPARPWEDTQISGQSSTSHTWPMWMLITWPGQVPGFFSLTLETAGIFQLLKYTNILLRASNLLFLLHGTLFPSSLTNSSQPAAFSVPSLPQGSPTWLWEIFPVFLGNQDLAFTAMTVTDIKQQPAPLGVQHLLFQLNYDAHKAGVSIFPVHRFIPRAWHSSWDMADQFYE